MKNLSNHFATQQQLIAALREPRRYPHAAKNVRVIETHISWVLLAGRFAYKIKKAVNLGFLDYTELAARRFCCEEEIRLNRRTAPDIYLDTVAIGGSADAPQFGAQPAIEYAVRMRRFPAGKLMDRLLMQGHVTAQHIDQLAAAIFHFHADISVVDASSEFGTAQAVRAAALQNFEQLAAQLDGEADRDNITALQAATEAEFLACKDLFEARRAQGFVRECHGDLHLGNIVLAGDTPVPFDCIEFNPALRWVDVMSELAFTVMDLLHRQHADFAWRLLNAYLEASGDYAGLAVLRFYLAYRATVRAKVCAIRAGQPAIAPRAKSDELAACRSYLALASQCLAQRRPALIITHGLPGSGKTTFSQLALQQLGAIRIRSDVERKRLFGLEMLENSRARGADIYGAEATRRTYAHLHEQARELLKAGFTVIVDAAFLRLDEREMFRRLAQNLSVPFAITSLFAPDTTLRARIQKRRNDASEADVKVLELLQAKQQPLSSIELACTARFTTGEAPNSELNAQGWIRLSRLLNAVAH
ncbi:MAG: AAA family ATPase [Sideroxydans sp.]|nr:AAA family ATPase [Sideroxydans sp.]